MMARNERKGIMPKVLPVLEQLLGSVALIAGIFSGLLAGSFLMMKVLAPKLKSATGRKELLYGQPALKHDTTRPSSAAALPPFTASSATKAPVSKPAVASKPMLTDLSEKVAVGPAVPPLVAKPASAPANGHLSATKQSSVTTKQVSATSNGERLSAPTPAVPVAAVPAAAVLPAAVPTTGAAHHVHEAEAEDDYDGTTEDEAVSTDLSAPSTPRGGATGPGAATEPHKHGRRTRKVLKKIKAAFTPHHSDATA